MVKDIIIGTPICRKKSQQGKNDTRKQHEGHRNAEDPLSPPDILKRHTLRCNDGNRHRHTGLGNCHREKINRKRHLVKADAFAAQNTRNKNPIQGTDNLDDKTGNREDERPLQERFALARFLFK